MPLIPCSCTPLACHKIRAWSLKQGRGQPPGLLICLDDSYLVKNSFVLLAIYRICNRARAYPLLCHDPASANFPQRYYSLVCIYVSGRHCAVQRSSTSRRVDPLCFASTQPKYLCETELITITLAVFPKLYKADFTTSFRLLLGSLYGLLRRNTIRRGYTGTDT